MNSMNYLQNLELPLSFILADMESQGVKVDTERLA